MTEMETRNGKYANDIRHIINAARTQAVRSVDFCRVQMHRHMGKRKHYEQEAINNAWTGREQKRTTNSQKVNKNTMTQDSKKRFVALAIGLAATLCLCLAPLRGQEFVHPGMLHSQADLDFLREKAAGEQEPWHSAWKELRKSRLAQPGYTPHPRSHVARGPYNKPDIGATDFLRDGAAAYTMSLQWAATRHKAYAEKAAEILNRWACTLDSVTMGDRKLLIGMAGIFYLNAAEIIRHTSRVWKKKDQKAFERMVMGVWYPVIRDFQPTYNGNWDAAIGQTMLCIGIFMERRDIFEKACKHLRDGATNGSIKNYFMPNGQCQESGRDQTHTQMGLGYLCAACEVAWKQGVDLYSAFNNRLAAGYEYTARYMLGEEVPYVRYRDYRGKAVFGNEISPKGRGKFAPIYERAYRHYHDRCGLPMPYTRKALERSRIEGESTSHLSWCTLMNAGYPAR